jgi:putative Mn2+ efflux pump MntP
VTIFALTAIFAGIDVVKHTTTLASWIMLVMWVFLWSTLWRAILSRWTVLLKQKLQQTVLHYINLISGIVIIIFACLLLWEIIFS